MAVAIKHAQRAALDIEYAFETCTVDDAAVARVQKAHRAQQCHAPERLVVGREGLLFPFMALTGHQDRLVFTVGPTGNSGGDGGASIIVSGAVIGYNEVAGSTAP